MPFKTKHNLVGNKFGRLTVIEKIGKTPKRLSIWKCICDCGKIKEVLGINLVHKKTISCGCFSKETTSKYSRKPNGIAAFNQLLHSYKKGAENRNLEWKLSENDFKIITSQNCYYCNAKPSSIQNRNSTTGSYIYNGIDRLNNDIGYLLTNCVPCCKICNRMKNVLNKTTFLSYIKNIYFNRIKG